MQLSTLARSLALLCIHIATVAADPLPTYSVVDVDGGSGNAAGGQATTTIYKTITESASKITVTEKLSAATVTVTETSPAATVTITAPGQAYEQPKPSSILFASSSIDVLPTSVSISSPVSSPTSTAYYDNGLWHTSYAIKSTSTSIVNLPASSISVPALPSGTGTAYKRRQNLRARKRAAAAAEAAPQ